MVFAYQILCVFYLVNLHENKVLMNKKCFTVCDTKLRNTLLLHLWPNYKNITCLKSSAGIFYAPAIKWLGHIVLPHSVIRSFCHSVLLSFRHYGFNFHSLFKSYMEIFKWNLVHRFFIIVSAHYLHYKLTFWIEIRYMGLSQEYAGWVRIWVQPNNFRQSYSPWT